jgi:hypothetical protein
VNECSACELDFASVAAFDAHRIGRYPQRGPAEYQDRRVRGLVPLDEGWQPKYGRRCLDTEELLALGFAKDKRGRWVHPREARRERRRVRVSEGAPTTQDAMPAGNGTPDSPRARTAA